MPVFALTMARWFRWIARLCKCSPCTPEQVPWTGALICLIAIAYFYIMNAISQVNDALINAKMESKIARTTALLTAALICLFLPSIGITLLGTVYPVFTTNSLSRLMEALVQLNSLVSPLLYSYRDRKIRKAVLELLGMRKPHASQLVAPRFVKANELAAVTMQLTMKKLVQLTIYM